MAVSARIPSRRRRRRVFVVLAVVVVLAAAAAATWWFLHRRGGEAAAAAPETVTVSLAPYQVTVSGPGTLEPARSVALTPDVGGRIVTIASVGDRVAQGATVATLDTATFQRSVDDATLALQKAQANLAALQAGQAKSAASTAAQVSSARAAVDSAQRTLDTQQRSLDLTQRLFDQGSASQDELKAAQDATTSAQEALDNAKTTLDTQLRSQTLQQQADQQDLNNAQLAVKQAELTLANAQQDLASTTVTAPFAGVVSTVDAQVGEAASSNGPLLTLVDDGRLEFDAQIAETDIAQVEPGQGAQLTVDAISGTTFAAKVTHIAPTATMVSNIPVFYVTVEVDNTDHALRGGMTGTADIVTQEIPSTFQVPARAVLSGRQGSLVRVAQADGSFRPVPVQQVASSGLNAVLTGDVPEGSVVLVSNGTAGGAPAGQNSGFPRNGGPPGGFPIGGNGFRPNGARPPRLGRAVGGRP